MAQIKFNGSVTDQDGITPLVAATVLLTDGVNSYSALTSEDGRFAFQVAAGTYELTIAYYGYISIEEKVNLEFTVVKQYKMIPSAIQFEGIEVSGLRAGGTIPSTTTNISRKELQLLDQSKDLPYFLNNTPSTVVSSDAGNGVGYTGIRIRGIDPTRINVTINDIPLNDAESQGVYWVNTPDLASGTGSIQIQRGVGTSTNGAAAFGASVNVQTDAVEDKKFARASLSYGSFNTRRLTAQLGSGVLKGGWGLQGRFSSIASDGFIDRASSNLNSAQFTAVKYYKKSSIKAIVLLGKERTYQAWWGIPQPKYTGNKEELDRYINQLWIAGADLDNLQNSDPRTYNYYTYENQVDDYMQNHAQLFYTRKISVLSNLRLGLHYTRGKGYFEEFNPYEQYSSYGMDPYVLGSDTFDYGSLTRRRWLDNHFYGAIGNLSLTKNKLKFNFGGALNQYLGRHFGEVIATEFTGYEGIQNIYYDEDAKKTDGNIYGKMQYEMGKFHPYIDMQLRSVNYNFIGPNESGSFEKQNVQYQFFNPKLGASFKPSYNWTFYGMWAIGNREPVRQDLVAASPANRPNAEKVSDTELGLKLNKSRFIFGATAYFMNYTDALVLNGQVNDVGLYTRVNVDESSRKGLELEAVIHLTGKISFGGNITFSKNKIVEYTEYVDNWEPPYNQATFTYKNTDIAFSPNRIAAGSIRLKLSKALNIEFQGKYVGTQYLDNTMSADRKLDAFGTISSSIIYEKDPKGKVGKINFSLFLNNLTNVDYAPNGYTFSGIIGGQRQSFNYVYPVAGFNWMAKFSIAI